MNKVLKKLAVMFMAAALMIAGVAVAKPTMAYAASAAEIESNSAKLTLNQEYEDSLPATNSEKWYSFEITEKGHFAVKLGFTSNTNVDKVSHGWDVSIYSAGDLSNAIGTYTKITSATTSMDYPFPVGKYYLKVNINNSYFAPVGVEYGLTVKFTPDNSWELESNDLIANANEITVNAEYIGNIYCDSDKDYYKFTIAEDGVFTVKLEPDDSCNLDNINWGWNLTVYDTNKEVIHTYDKICSSTTTKRFPFAAGTYYIKIEERNQSFPCVGCNYKFKVNYFASKEWESEYNNEQKDADVINVNEFYSGTLYKEDDVDWYKINVNTTGYSTIKLQVGDDVNPDDISWGWHIILLDSDGKEVINYDKISANKETQIFAVKKGTYYLKVLAANTYFAPTNLKYSIKYCLTENKYWEAEWNNEIADANTATVNKEYKAVLGTNEDVDYYKLKVAADGKVKFTLAKAETATADAISKGWDMVIYKGATKVGEITGTTNSKNVILDLKKGTYTIKICANNSYFAPTQVLYKFSTKYAPAPKTPAISKVAAGKSGSKHTETITWKKVSDADGYYIYRSTSKNGEYKKIATVAKGSKSATSLKYVDKKSLKGKTTYYYKVVAYKKTNGITAISTSSAKGAKTK